MNIPRWIAPVVALAVLGATARAELINGVKAIVHDSVVTFDEVNAEAAAAARLLQQRHRTDPEEFRKKLAAVLDENLDRLVEHQLVLRDFEQAGFSFPDSLVEEALQDEIRRRFNGDRATFIKTLQADGMTVEKYRQRLRDQLVVGALRSRNISRELVISPHKIEKYYLENRDKYRVEDQVKLRMIVINKSAGTDTPPARALAAEILAKLKEGAAFVEMASVYSQGSQRNQGGDWGWVEKSVLKPELADVAFALKAGEFSDIIEQPEACYLMLAEDIRPAHVRPLSEIRDEIERTLLVQERDRLQKRYVEKLRSKTFVRYF